MAWRRVQSGTRRNLSPDRVSHALWLAADSPRRLLGAVYRRRCCAPFAAGSGVVLAGRRSLAGPSERPRR